MNLKTEDENYNFLSNKLQQQSESKTESSSNSVSMLMDQNLVRLQAREAASKAENYIRLIRQNSARANPVTVKWLLSNYETAEGVSLPRSVLYSQYLNHCLEFWLEPMNPASFGKLIRSVFSGLRTRRLGTRGHSKYHYYGIRIKANSSLNPNLNHINTNWDPRFERSAQQAAVLANSSTSTPQKSFTTTVISQPGASNSLDVTSSSISNNFTFTPNTCTPNSRPKTQATGATFPIINKGAQKRKWNLVHYLESSPQCNNRATNNLTMEPILKKEDKEKPKLKPILERPGKNITEFSQSSFHKSYFGDIKPSKFSLENFDRVCELSKIISNSPGLTSEFTNVQADDILQFLDEFYLEKNSRISKIEEAPELFISIDQFTTKAVHFAKIFEAHLAEIHGAILKCHIEKVRFFWTKFWRQDYKHYKWKPDEEKVNNFELLKPPNSISSPRQISLRSWCEQPCISKFIDISEFHMYQSLLHTIQRECYHSLPPILNQFLLRAIKNLKVVLNEKYDILFVQVLYQRALSCMSSSFSKARLDSLDMFIRGLRRIFESQQLFLSVNLCLTDSAKLNCMFEDIVKIDFEAIQNQCEWAVGQQGDLNEWALLNTGQDLSEDQIEFQMYSTNQLDYEELPSSIVDSSECMDEKMFMGSPVGNSKAESPQLKSNKQSDLAISRQMKSVPIMIQLLKHEICELLKTKLGTFSWVSWIDWCIVRCAKKVLGMHQANFKPIKKNFINHIELYRQIMLNWILCSSLLIRELTLRSANSFGHCHILRLFCDEYAIYRLEQLSSMPEELLNDFLNQTIDSHLEFHLKNAFLAYLSDQIICNNQKQQKILLFMNQQSSQTKAMLTKTLMLFGSHIDNNNLPNFLTQNETSSGTGRCNSLMNILQQFDQQDQDPLLTTQISSICANEKEMDSTWCSENFFSGLNSISQSFRSNSMPNLYNPQDYFNSQNHWQMKTDKRGSPQMTDSRLEGPIFPPLL